MSTPIFHTVAGLFLQFRQRIVEQQLRAGEADGASLPLGDGLRLTCWRKERHACEKKRHCEYRRSIHHRALTRSTGITTLRVVPHCGATLRVVPHCGATLRVVPHCGATLRVV